MWKVARTAPVDTGILYLQAGRFGNHDGTIDEVNSNLTEAGTKR